MRWYTNLSRTACNGCGLAALEVLNALILNTGSQIAVSLSNKIK